LDVAPPRIDKKASAKKPVDGDGSQMIEWSDRHRRKFSRIRLRSVEAFQYDPRFFK